MKKRKRKKNKKAEPKRGSVFLTLWNKEVYKRFSNNK